MTFVLVGHGSRDPRSAAALHRLAERVRARRPGLDVRLCFLELSVPSLEQVLSGLGGSVVVVPALLGEAYHARTDIPERVRTAMLANPRLDVTVAGTLGSRRALREAVVARASSTVDGWVLAATGSSHPSANDAVRAAAEQLGRRLGVAVRAGFVTNADPDIASAVGALRSARCATVGLLPWFLAPGRLLDRAIASASAVGVSVVAEPLADHDGAADAALDAYEAATAGRAQHAAGRSSG